MTGEREIDDLALRLLGRGQALERPRLPVVALGSAASHALIALLIVLVPSTTTARRGPDIQPLFRITPLVAPPTQLTQKAPNRSSVSPEVNLQDLLARPEVRPSPVQGSTQPAAPKTFPAPVPKPAEPKPVIEPPKLEIGPREAGEFTARLSPPGLGNPQVQPVPAPQIQAEEKPKIAFERPGGFAGQPAQSGAAQGRVPLPQRSTIDETARELARSGGGGLVVGDLGEGIGGLGEALNSVPVVPRNMSSLELLSDPMGADFKPYLIRILSAVRRNWMAVIPESARLGRRGKVQIQFAINRDGGVPKLVIALASGTEALDRAAVAGVSASNPFPPLPDEFKGQQVRLQFTFLYNQGR